MNSLLTGSLVRRLRGGGRIALGVLAGYASMALLIVVLFSLAYLALGADGSFKEGSWDVSGAWLVMSIVVGIGAAFLGGFVCRWVSRRMRGVWVLAGVIIILGIAGAQVPEDPVSNYRALDRPWAY